MSQGKLLKHHERRPQVELESTEDRYLTAKEVAKRYGLSVQWVYHCEALKPYRRYLGRKLIRFRESDLEKFEAYRAQWPRETVSGKRSGARGKHIENQDVIRQTSSDERLEEARKRLKFDIY